MADFLIGKSETKGQLLVENLSTSLGRESVVGWSHSFLEVTSQLYRRCVWKMESHCYPWTEATRQVEQRFSFKILRLHHCWSAVLQLFTYIRGIDGNKTPQDGVRKWPIKANLQMQEATRRIPLLNDTSFGWVGWWPCDIMQSDNSFNCRYCLVVFKHPWARYIQWWSETVNLKVTLFERKADLRLPLGFKLFVFLVFLGTFTVTTSPPKISGFPGRGSKESNEDVAVDEGNNESVPDLWLPSGENRLNLSALGLFRKNADDGKYLNETIHGWKVFCKGSIINDVGLGLAFWLIVLSIDLCCLISGWCVTYQQFEAPSSIQRVQSFLAAVSPGIQQIFH